MTVSVRYLAQVRAAAGRATEQVTLSDASSLVELLRNLAERHGTALRNLLFDPSGGLQPTILVFVGDEQVSGNDAVALKDGDTVTILSPMAGG